MPKRGYNPFEKQSSPISNAQVLSLMGAYNFEVQELSEPIIPKTSDRKAVASAKREFGERAHISKTGESVFFQGRHVETRHAVTDIRVRISNMLGIGEREALYALTGIPELKPTRD